MKKRYTLTLCWLAVTVCSYGQVKNSYQYNTSMPYGTLDIRTRISSTDYYYLRENQTFSFRENGGSRTNTYVDMTGWDSGPYNEGHLRRKRGTTDHFVMNYRLLFPQGYQRDYAEGYPMIVHLHGAHERANCLYANCYHSDWDYTPQENSPPAPTSATHKLLNNDDNLNVGGRQYLDARNLAGTRLPNDPSMPERAFPGFVVVPQMMNSWDSLQVEDVVRIVRLLTEQHNIDPDRIYIQGLSIGGYGVFEAMKRASWLFAAALPMAGVWDANIFAQNQQDKVAHMPVWIFQGGEDPRPSPEYTENIVTGLEAAGAEVRYSLYSDLGHVVWYRAYGQRDYYTWMLSKSKSKLHVFANNTVIDKSKSQYPKLMLAEGFLAYQWEKDGTIIANSSNTLTVTAPGKYRARFSRESSSPSGSQWNRWSQVVTITDNGSSVPTPTVTVNFTSPDNGDFFTAPASISMAASASTDEGSLARVEFYNGNTKLGQDTSSPYTFTWSNVPAGSYTLMAKAIHSTGVSSEDEINITVSSLPTVTITQPDDGQAFTAPASISVTTSTTGSNIEKVEFFNGSTRIGQDASSPYTFTWANVTAGNYTLVAKVTDAAGNSATDDVDIVVSDLPTINITNPDDGQSFTAPASISITTSTTGSNIDMVEFFNGSTRIGQDASSPYTFTWANVAAGNYTLVAKVTDDAGNSATDDVDIVVSDLPTINITNPDDGQSFIAPASISITTSTTGSNIDRVEFFNGSTRIGQDASSPYTFTWANITAGNYTLVAKVTDDAGNSATDEVDIVVDEEPTTPGGSCASTGSINVETWTGIQGKEISSIPLSTAPSSVSTVTLFETGTNIGDHYGSRVRGFVCPPATGDYIFWIATNDRGELWLSTNDSPSNKRMIAEVTGWTNPRQWNKYSGQQSASIRLQEGTRYYIEALIKEGTGSDHLSVGWQLPNGSLERPIPGSRLIPFDGTTNQSPTVQINSPSDGDTFTAPATINLAATASDGDGSISKVEFYNGSIKLGQDASAPYSFSWSNVAAGNYILSAKATDNAGASATAVVEVVVNGDSGEPGSGCASTGSIQAETWTGIAGKDLSTIPLNTAPDEVVDLTLFETEANKGDHYGTRVHGYICPPLTGNYTFWIATNDNGELWLSTDDDPANKSRIAYVSGWTNPKQWDKYSSQRSASVHLTAGNRYYIQALVKEGSGSDHLAVGWQMPDGANERPIGGNRLIPFSGSPVSDPDPEPEPEPDPSPTGTIEAEVWTGISGKDISTIPVDSPPDAVAELTVFETESSIGDNYGSRVRGYVHAPATGDYIFWIASDDSGELWLSSDENPANKTRIAYVSGWTRSREWNKFSTQASVPVRLEAGRKYYIEALLKEATGGDHLEVGWQLPGGALERPIPGTRLSKFGLEGSAMMARLAVPDTTDDRQLYSDFSIYPNPADGSQPRLTVSGYSAIPETVKTRVEIINMTGEVVFTETISCGGDCRDYLISINEQLVPGVYLVNLKTKGTTHLQRLLVR